jgi:hypothetical protein
MQVSRNARRSTARLTFSLLKTLQGPRSIDAARVARLLREAQSENAIRRAEAEAALAAIARQRQHRAWLLDPRLPGSTAPHLSVRDAGRVERWPLERGDRQDRTMPATGIPPTPRCWDRMTGPRSSPSAAASANKERGAGWNWR